MYNSCQWKNEWDEWMKSTTLDPEKKIVLFKTLRIFPSRKFVKSVYLKTIFGFWYFLHHVGWLFNIAALSRFDTDDRIWSTFCTGSPWEDISIERAEISCMSSCLFTSSTSFSSFIVYIIWFSSSTSSTSPSSTALYLSCPSLTPRLLPSFLYNFKAAKKMEKGRQTIMNTMMENDSVVNVVIVLLFRLYAFFVSYRFS